MTNGHLSVRDIGGTSCSPMTKGKSDVKEEHCSVMHVNWELLNLILRELNAQDAEWIMSSRNGLYQATMAFNVRGHEVSFTGKLYPSPEDSIQTAAAIGICHIREAHHVRVVDITYPQYHNALRQSRILQRGMDALV
uniref:Uncharacterized protein n=1 Tax=Nelumbo nucifera TaxID=4432 RepID=A0A822XKY3_NELNU|nr:TPA_asm: hypothetical protein HUJ06_022125 [Nelumbo nucifera]